tara:strand:- start:34 stop:816 length:783 start_codon:yes stop_codon:yes gene_type:complete
MFKKLGIGFVVILALVIIAYFGMKSDPEIETDISQQQSGPQQIRRAEPVRELPPTPPEVATTYNLTGDLPTLDSSDDVLFNHLSMLLSSVRLGLLNNDQFIRKAVLQVDNAAKGNLVYQHSPLRAPLGNLEIMNQEDGTLYINPESYARYNVYGDLMASIDTGLMVAYYRFYEPLLDEAYMELGYPEGSFRGTLITAIDQALAAPVIDGPVELSQPEANYVYANESLESLNMVQKQLLRMGPENTTKIQDALQRFKARIQ